MHEIVYERVLVPLDASCIPKNAVLCVEGKAQTSRAEPILLGPVIQGEYLDRPLREYLNKRTEELLSMGVRISPLSVQGHIAESLLSSAEYDCVDVFIIAIHGPYRLQRVKL